MYPNLKLQIWKSGIRQNRLAQMLGVDETMLSKIVNGFREPSQGLRARIAALLESQEEWLFERVSPPDAAAAASTAKAVRRS
jgi:transcriptional regulator with XRE-family HTH domain